jgi:hypothetical protein
MVNKVLSPDYSYNYRSFIANEVKYTLVGSKSETNEKVNLSEDCFLDESGKYHTIVREMIMQRQKEKKIQPVEESKITIPTISQKEWSKKAGRGN